MTIFDSAAIDRAHKCVDIAFDVCRLLEERINSTPKGSVGELPIEEVLSTIKFPAPLSRERADYIGGGIAYALNEYGANTVCLSWSIAHILEHALYEEDQSKLAG